MGAAAAFVLLAGTIGCSRAVDIVTKSLPDASVNVAYSFQLECRHCDTDQWALIQGTLPPGIGFNQRGRLSGTPTQAGVFNFTVQVTRSSSLGNPTNSASQGLSLTVR